MHLQHSTTSTFQIGPSKECTVLVSLTVVMWLLVREFNSINLVQSLQLAFTERVVIFINVSHIESVNLKAYDKGLQREKWCKGCRICGFTQDSKIR